MLEAGEGPASSKNDIVEVFCRAHLIDGAEFANTYGAEQRLTITLSDRRAVPGLKEALTLMSQGPTRHRFAPPQLARQGGGASRLIGPNETLIFEAELLSIG